MPLRGWAACSASAARTTAAAGPGGALVRPADLLRQNHPGPVRAVRVAQVLHRRDQLGGGVGPAGGGQGQRQLAGLGAGDPGPVGHAARAQPGDDEPVPAAAQPLAGRVAGQRAAEHRVVPVHRERGLSANASGLVRRRRGRAGRRRAPSPAAARRAGRRARRRSAAPGGCSTLPVSSACRRCCRRVAAPTRSPRRALQPTTRSSPAPDRRPQLARRDRSSRGEQPVVPDARRRGRRRGWSRRRLR